MFNSAYMNVAPIREMTPKTTADLINEKGLGKSCVLTFHQPYYISKIRYGQIDILKIMFVNQT